MKKILCALIWFLFLTCELAAQQTLDPRILPSGVVRQWQVDSSNVTQSNPNDPVSMNDSATIDVTNPSAGVIQWALKSGSVTDAMIVSITTKAKIPATTAFKDENNTWAGTQAFNANVSIGGAAALTLAGSSSGVISLVRAAAAGTYNFYLPTSAGVSGQPLLSAGGSNPMTFGTLALAAGGTNQTSWTAAKCVRVNAGGTGLESAANDCGTGTGGGDVSTSAANTYTGGNLNDFAAALMKLPGGAGYNPTTHGHIGTNNTDNTVRVGINGANYKFYVTASATSVANLNDLTGLALTDGRLAGWNGANLIAWTVTDCNPATEIVNVTLATHTFGCVTAGTGTVTGTGTNGTFSKWTGTNSQGNSSYLTETGGTGLNLTGQTSFGTTTTNYIVPNFSAITGAKSRVYLNVDGDEVVSTGSKTTDNLAKWDSSGRAVNGPSSAALRTKVCDIVIGDNASGSGVLQNDNDALRWCGNKFGATLTITSVECLYLPTGGTAPTVRPQITGGASDSILSSDLTCGSDSFASGTLNGTPTQTSNQNIDGNLVAAGGTAKQVIIRITGTLPAS